MWACSASVATPLTDDQFRERVKGACQERRRLRRKNAGANSPDACTTWPPTPRTPGTGRASTRSLCASTQTTHGTGGEILFYLSVGPEVYESIIQNIGAAQLGQGSRRWCAAETNPEARQRIIVEKPFGHDCRCGET